MRGKKSDPKFISKYISTLVAGGITSSDDILQAAKDEVSSIDSKIKEMEDLKVRRTKLLDVISSFEKKSLPQDNGRSLPLYTLEYPQLCKLICDTVAVKNNVSVGEWEVDQNSTFIFCLKQLLTHKILSRCDDTISRGERFEEYAKLVLHQG